MISFRCEHCQKKINAKPTLAGRTLPCPGCKNSITVPTPEPETTADEFEFKLAPLETPAANTVVNKPVQPIPIAEEIEDEFRVRQLPVPAKPAPLPRSETEPPSKPKFVVPEQPRHLFSKERRPSTLTTRLHWFFAIALLPLVIWTIFPEDKSSIASRLEETIALVSQDELTAIESNETSSSQAIDNLFRSFPDNRIVGAFLPRNTIMHWFLAILAAGLFFAILLLMSRDGSAEWWHLLVLGSIIATGGIALLLTIQFLAAATGGFSLRGRGIGIIIFAILKFIAFSYYAAEDPNNGFILSMLGYTFGVGLCEELSKIFPILVYAKTDVKIKWRGAMIWGLASGVGFGIAEGIVYSADKYNGICTSGIYLVRFLSCVSLHAIWTASVALIVYRYYYLWHQADTWYEHAYILLLYLAGPMVLHGLYDTLLKQEHEFLALLSAALSFGVLQWLIHTAPNYETDE
jgi:RsiW-degrading membrane proteinase PrsW (M82 family)